MLRELDVPYSAIQDSAHDLSNAGFGRQMARVAISILEDRGIAFNSSCTRLLAMGAGHSKAELGFAEKLGIPLSQVVLLDKAFPSYAKERLAEQYPEVELIERGMFDFLSDHGVSREFSMVTLIGVEYIARKVEAASALAEELAGKMLPGGLVLVVPCGANMDAEWKQKGFEVVEGFKTWVDMAVYRYSGAVEE